MITLVEEKAVETVVYDEQEVFGWVKETFFASIPNEEIMKYSDQMTERFIQTVDFLESNSIEFSFEAVQQNQDAIVNWQISEDDTVETNKFLSDVEKEAKATPCTCKKNALQIVKIKKFGLIIIISLILLILFKTSNSN